MMVLNLVHAAAKDMFKFMKITLINVATDKKKYVYGFTTHTHTHSTHIGAKKSTLKQQARAILKNINMRKCNGDFQFDAARNQMFCSTVW